MPLLPLTVIFDCQCFVGNCTTEDVYQFLLRAVVVGWLFGGGGVATTFA